MVATATKQKPVEKNSEPAPTIPTPTPEKGKLTLRQAVDEFGESLTERHDMWAPMLPEHITPAKFRSVAITAVNFDPDLLRADRLSLINACCLAATDGLLPDKREGALVIFRSKQEIEIDGRKQERWIKKVQWMPMVHGIIKKVRQSGEIRGLRARIVYTNEVTQDRFSFKVVDGIERLNHEPILFDDAGEPCLAYAVATFRDGFQEIEPLRKEDIAKIRAVSRAQHGPWSDWTDEMWKKSAIRRLAKRLPLSSEVMAIITRDDRLTDFTTLPPPEIQSVTRAAALMSADGAGPIADASALAEGEVTLDEVTDELKEFRDDGEKAAAQGTSALDDWFDWLGADKQEQLRSFYEAMQSTAADADGKAQP